MRNLIALALTCTGFLAAQGIGQFSRVQDVVNIQPVVPIHLSENWILISRWITPVIYQPDLGSTCRANGLGDLNPSFFLSPAHPGRLIWGFGPALQLPTATDPTLGQGKWAAGPSLVLLTQPKHWTLGFLSNNIRSFAGLARSRQQSAARPVRRRFRQDDPLLRSGHGLADARLLQRHPSAGPALPEVASPPAGGASFPLRAMTAG